MLAILTFVSTVILGILPNNDIYTRTVNSYQNGEMVDTRTETVADWNFDSTKGWFYVLPEVNVELNVSQQTVDVTNNELNVSPATTMEFPEINVTRIVS